MLREAGEAAAASAPPRAARWFEGALRLLPRRAPAEERVELLLARATVARRHRPTVESHAALLESTALVPREARGAARAADDEVRRGGAPARPLRRGAARGSSRRSPSSGEPGSPEAVALMVELAINEALPGATATA